MGVDTHLYLSNRWRLEDVIEVINQHICIDSPVQAKPSDHCATFGSLQSPGNWFCGYHLETDTPLGRFLMLSLRHSDAAVERMKTIARILGGALEERDCDGNIEFIDGRLSDESQLQYHLKYAVIHGHSGETDREGINGLINSINEWRGKYSKSKKAIPTIKEDLSTADLVDCPVCLGAGAIVLTEPPYELPCLTCHGSGQVPL